jgi:hypothetical protein
LKAGVNGFCIACVHPTPSPLLPFDNDRFLGKPTASSQPLVGVDVAGGQWTCQAVAFEFDCFTDLSIGVHILIRSCAFQFPGAGRDWLANGIMIDLPEQRMPTIQLMHG